MFEESLVESRGLIVSPTKRWTALGSAIVQCAVAALLVAVSLTHPQFPPLHSDAPQIVAPSPVKPPMVRVAATAASSSAMSLPAVAMAVATLPNAPSVLSKPTGADKGPEPVVATIHMGDGGSLSALSKVGVGSAMAAVPPVVRRAGPVAVSSGVSAGMLLTPIQPVYPAMARVAGVQGTVVMEAVISKAGRIESLRAMSGPSMLRQAALDAVQAARYRPYQLNGQPTEVQTTITVVFRLRD